jgi:hypothetical protein
MNEQEILAYLRSKGHVRAESVVTLRQAFPTNMVLFDTERITTDMSPQPKKTKAKMETKRSC